MASIRKQLGVWLVGAVVLLFALAAAFCYQRTRAVLASQFDVAIKNRAPP